MAREYDSQLMESVGVRRRRLRDALLFGTRRGRQTMDEYVGKAFIGVAVAAIGCAGCVGWSYLDRELGKQKQQQTPVQTTITPTETPTFTPTTSRTPEASTTGTPATRTPSRNGGR